MINEVTEKLNFLKGKLSLDIFIIKVLDKSGKELFLTFQSGGAVEQESWFDASWFMTPEEAKAKSTEMSDKDLVVEHVDINKYDFSIFMERLSLGLALLANVASL